MIKSKKQMFVIISVFALVVLLGTVSYAFFNYTRTGVSNTIRVGRIYFNTTQNNTINLTNVFPTDSNNLDNTNSATVTVNVTGDTEYSGGIEYKISIVDVNNTVNGKEVPVSFSVSTANLGTKSHNYYNERGRNKNVYKLTEEELVQEGEYALIGYIKPDDSGINGSVDITAYMDINKIVISDTYDGTESDDNGTTNDFIGERTVLTSEEWNSLASNPISFKVKAEANEGIWVEKERFLTMTYLFINTNWLSIRSKLSSIEFHKDGVAPDSYVARYDVTATESDPNKGPVTLYTVNDGLGTNTYKAIFVANDEIYLPVSAIMQFANCTNLIEFNGENLRTDIVFDMQALFYNCTKLKRIIGTSAWNTSNVETMSTMFGGCDRLESIDGLTSWDTSAVTNMGGMFNQCHSLRYVDISHFDMTNVTVNRIMFQETYFRTIVMPNNYTRIDDFMFNHNTAFTGTTFTIPKTVTSIGTTHMFYDLGQDGVFTKFIVEDGSTSFKTIDDILYSYDGTRLISIPRGKTFTNNTYEMPEGITFLNELCFSRNRNIDKVIFPNSYVIESFIDEDNNDYGFINSGSSLNLAIYVFTSIKEYEVKNDNPNYSSYGGCIYSKDGTQLIAVPTHYTGVLNIKAGTTTIGQEAIASHYGSYIDSITQINIPASVTTIDSTQLTTFNSLMSRSTNPVTITIDSGNTAYEIVNNQIVAK